MTIVSVTDTVIMPWDAVPSKITGREYLRKSRFFLEVSGYVDPKLMHHKRGVNKMMIQAERDEINSGMQKFISDAQADPRLARNLVIRFIESEKKRVDAGEITGRTVLNVTKPIKAALDLNDVPISWKKILKLLPRANKKSRDREYRLDEIQRITALASIHIKVSILLMASSGMRVGGFDYLRVGDIRPVKDEKNEKVLCGSMTVYSGEGDDEYGTLISKEAYLLFEQYLTMRRANGEQLTEDSPAIVVRSGLVRCSSGTIRNAIGELLWKAGVRTEKKKRYEAQVCHGFRKFFDNVAKDYVDEPYVEKLIGHDTGTKEHYDRHIPKPALEQYLRAMPYLSVDPVYRVEAELSGKLEEKQGEIDHRYNQLRIESLEKDAKIQRLEDEMAEWREVMRNLKESPYGRVVIERPDTQS